MINQYMKAAVNQAKKALECGEVPVGAVIVKEGKIIGRGFNKKEKTKVGTEHAEIIAIRKACKKIGDWRLNDCTLYVTLEPCLMCIGAVLETRIEKIIYGAKNQSKKHKKTDFYNLKLEQSQTFGEEASNLLKTFFINKR